MTTSAFRRARPWALLLLLSLALAILLEKLALPASFLLGPMMAAIALGLNGASLRLPRSGFLAAQTIIGCLVGRTLTPAILTSLLADGGIMLLVVASTILAGAVVGVVLVKGAVLPGTTAAWGSSPGGASAMVAMAADYGADIRLVAFMQYLRVLMVVSTASLVARLLPGAGIAASPPPPWDLPQGVPPAAFAATLAVAAAGLLAGRLLRLPAGALLGPLLLGGLLQGGGLVTLALPPWLLCLGYLLVGWYIGLGFTRDTLRHAWQALPRLVLATLLLLALCALSAWMLTRLLHTDALTAYLATSPGGLDSVAIIAIGSHADIPFVMAVQTLRVFAVLLTGPAIAKAISRWV